MRYLTGNDRNFPSACQDLRLDWNRETSEKIEWLLSVCCPLISQFLAVSLLDDIIQHHHLCIHALPESQHWRSHEGPFCQNRLRAFFWSDATTILQASFSPTARTLSCARVDDSPTVQAVFSKLRSCSQSVRIFFFQFCEQGIVTNEFDALTADPAAPRGHS